MTVLFLTCFWFFGGLFFVRLFCGNNHPILNAAIAYPVGISIWATCFIMVKILTGMVLNSSNAYTTYSLFGVIVIALLIINVFKTRIRPREFIFYGAVLIILNSTGLLADRLNIIIFGRDIFLSQYLGFETSPARGLPVFLHAFLDKDILLGRQYWPFVWPTVAISMAMNLTWLTLAEVRRQGLNGVLSWVLAIIPATLLFSTYLIVLSIFYFNHHIIAASLILIFVSLFWLIVYEQNISSIYLAMFVLFVFTITRIEGILAAIVLLGIFLSMPSICVRVIRRALLSFAFLALSWQFYLAARFLSGSFISVSQQLIMLVAVTAFLVTLFVMTFLSRYLRLLRNLDLILMLALTMVLILLCLIRPIHMLLSNLHVVQNMLSSGYWGVFWWIIVLAGINLLFFRLKYAGGSRFVDACLLTVVSSLILILDLGGLRIPYRLQWGDSANRMLIHFAPILVFWISAQAAAYYRLQVSGLTALNVEQPRESFFPLSLVLKTRGYVINFLENTTSLCNDLLFLSGKLLIIVIIAAALFLTRIRAMTYSDVYNVLSFTEWAVKKVEARMMIVPEHKKIQLQELVDSIERSISGSSIDSDELRK